MLFSRQNNILKRFKKIHKPSPIISIWNIFGKRVPHAASNLKGSLTVEAALVLPIFISVVVIFIYVIQCMQIQLHIQKALHNQVMDVCGYAYYLQDSGMNETVEKLLGAEYIKSRVINDVGKDYLDSSYIIKGKKGIYLNVTGGQETGVLDVALEYTTKAPFDILGLSKMNLVSRARCRLWTGRAGDTDENDEAEKTYVYVTANGRVYHTSSECTYIKSKIQFCSYGDISEKRNKSGAKYYECVSCSKDKKAWSTVYYTEYGTRYHYSAECKNIHSDIYTLLLEDAKARYPLCSKCEKGGS